MSRPRAGSAVALAALLFATPLCRAAAQDSPIKPAGGRLLQDTWETAYLGDVRAGYVRYTVRELDEGGGKFLRASKELNLSVRRFGEVSSTRAELGTDETPDGKVLGVFMRQGLGKQQTMELIGVVNGKTLDVTVRGQYNLEREIPWPEGVIGMTGEHNLIRTRKPKPGESFSYRYFEPTANAVVTINATVQEVVPLGQGPAAGRKVLAVELKPERLLNIQLPSSTQFVDAETYEPVRTKAFLPGLGDLTLVPSSRAQATAPIESTKLPDLGLTQSIRLLVLDDPRKRLDQPHELAGIVYRIKLPTLPKDDKVVNVFAQDGRQHLADKDEEARRVDLEVRAIRGPQKLSRPAGQVGEEYRASNYFLNSADPKVRELAQRAVGDETDDWRKALRIERWVHANMKVLNFSEAMATADHVARTLEGDCTEFAMLTAAMCRAVGVPSRIALGLVYFERRDPRTGAVTPMMGFHMWTEVWAKGQWLGLDATLGQGGVGPAHLKVSDSSWHDTKALTPLLPVMRLLSGRPEIQVIQTQR
jgi:transglutaminase-like putative cysteine protease